MADTFQEDLMIAMFLLRITVAEAGWRETKNKKNLKDKNNYFGWRKSLSYKQEDN